MSDEFDLSRLSNAGKEAARAHKKLRRAANTLEDLVVEALAAGLTERQIEAAMLKFCTTHEEMLDASSLFMAVAEVKAKKAEKETT